MKHKLATLYFDDDGEGTISLSKDFYSSDWVTQADALKDWLYWTEKLYDALFEGEHLALTKEKAKEVMTPKTCFNCGEPRESEDMIICHSCLAYEAERGG